MPFITGVRDIIGLSRMRGCFSSTNTRHSLASACPRPTYGDSGWRVFGADMKCRGCGVELVQENTTPSRWRAGIRSCAMCDRKQAKEWIKNNPERARAAQKLCIRRRRLRALLAYGCECECCGIKSPEFLSFQHANGNGRKHRDIIGDGAHVFLKDIKDRGYPVRFDLPDGTPIHIKILCHNCHYSIDYHGYCHTKKIKATLIFQYNGD